jgi:uncharacterized protein (DUF1501 family)
MSFSLAGQNVFGGTVVNQYAVDAGAPRTAPAATRTRRVSASLRWTILEQRPGSWIMDTASNTLADNAAAYNALIARVRGRARACVRHHDAPSAAAGDGQRAHNVTLDTKFPDSDLGNQLAAIALLLKVRGPLGMNRQVFFVSTGGYDTHGDQLASQSDNLLDLGQSLNAFYNATVELGIDSGVTAFTASEFGRSLAVNVDGTDHGWGGHHFVVGGAVRGQRFYGAMPSLLAGTDVIESQSRRHRLRPDHSDTGSGSVCGDARSLVGVSNSDLGTIFPTWPLQRIEPALPG